MPGIPGLKKFTRALTLALNYRDLQTRSHSDRVSTLALRLGQACGLSSRELEYLAISASFHDIGKLGVPDNVLMKPGRLDQQEKELIERHCTIGAEIMLATEIDGAEEVAAAVRHHHEHFNGQGYPHRLAGNNIPLYSRIIGIADSYDAMIETRAYHRARSHEEALGVLLQETGRKHDPDLMRLFCKVFGSPCPGLA
ncbi:MAG: HD domain-containing phosphohydrolase [Pseudomonadota bacterium]